MRFSPTTLLILGLLACKPPETPKSEAAGPPTPASVARTDFSHLAYLQGRWRGKDAAGKLFYERYATLNDSTLQSFSFSDSTFAVPSDSGQIRWAGGQVRTGTEQVSWIATIWTVDSVRFDPERGASNSFTWVRAGPDAWLARLETRGSPAPVLYEMTRVPD